MSLSREAKMRLGVIFPQTEIGSDPGGIRDYVQAVESLGYDHMILFEHVLGADPAYYTDRTLQLNLDDQFHEPFVTLGFIAALTQRIELVTGVLVLPQRQTVLVAKQAAEADVLSKGRLRLAVAVGWNPVEYEALGMDFKTRGRRISEQVDLLRALWTGESVDFSGLWHRVTHAGLNPMPIQRPIPLWFGGGSDAVLRRVGRIGDGWFPATANFQLGEGAESAIDRVHEYARGAGRDPSTIGIQIQVNTANRSLDELIEEATRWRSFGATHLALYTVRSGFSSIDQHIRVIRGFKEAFN